MLNWVAWIVSLAGARRVKFSCSCGMNGKVASNLGWMLTDAEDRWFDRHKLCEPGPRAEYGDGVVVTRNDE